MDVGAICSRRAVCVPESATLAEVALLMSEEHVGAIVVTTGGTAHPRVAGIITDRDIVRVQLERVANLSGLSARETMTPKPLVFDEGEPLDGAIAHLRARGVRRAPVIGLHGEPVGLISIDDLLAHLAATLIGLAGIVTRQVRNEGMTCAAAQPDRSSSVAYDARGSDPGL
jgi:CBS domain-containing protein